MTFKKSFAFYLPFAQKLERVGFTDQTEVGLAGAGFEVAIVSAPRLDLKLSDKGLAESSWEEWWIGTNSTR